MTQCSIDSLLERTIKHMLFMQCVTKHADKIDKCAESKVRLLVALVFTGVGMDYESMTLAW